MLPFELELEALRAVKPAMRYPGGDFAAWQLSARAKLRDLLGMNTFTPCSPDVKIEYERGEPDYTETRFTFETEPGWRSLCVLRTPKTEIKGFMICLQGHSTGMHNSFGIALYPGDAEDVEGGDRDFARQAVARGYAAAALEQRCFGECGGTPRPDCQHASLLALIRGRTVIGERVWDVARLTDLINDRFNPVGLPVYVMGNSGGGTASYYAAAAEPSLAGTIPSCSVCTFRDSIGFRPHCACNYIPDIANYFDMGDLAGLIAPRPLVQVNGREDPIFLLSGALDSFKEAERLYAAAGAPDKCRLVVGDGGHRFYAAEAWKAFEEIRT